MRVGSVLSLLSIGNFGLGIYWLVKFVTNNEFFIFAIINFILGCSLIGLGLALNKKGVTD